MGNIKGWVFEDNAAAFDRSGFAALSDFETPAWKEIFPILEKEFQEFLDAHKKDPIYPPDYPWLLEPLRNWSRSWEYPFIYHHLRALKKQLPQEHPAVIDIGSGIVPFPFCAARLGYNVTAVDNDPMIQTGMEKAISRFPAGSGTVTFKLSQGSDVPASDASADCVYCISVIEHIPNFDALIDDTARVLKPGGLLLLTVDIDRSGRSDLGPQRHRALLAGLQKHFDFVYPDRSIHPSDVLNSNSGPYPMGSPDTAYRRYIRPLIHPFVRWARRRMHQPAELPGYLSVQAFVLKKRSL